MVARDIGSSAHLPRMEDTVGDGSGFFTVLVNGLAVAIAERLPMPNKWKAVSSGGMVYQFQT